MTAPATSDGVSHTEDAVDRIAAGVPRGNAAAMSALMIGCAGVSTNEQDLTVQRQALERLGVPPDRIYTDRGLTGTNRDRPGLPEAMAACRDGDTFLVTKLDLLARSLRDARDIADELTERHVTLNLGRSRHDPNDPVGPLLFNVLAIVAEIESDLIRARTPEGMQLAKAKGRLRRRQPKPTAGPAEPARGTMEAGSHRPGRPRT